MRKTRTNCFFSGGSGTIKTPPLPLAPRRKLDDGTGGRRRQHEGANLDDVVLDASGGSRGKSTVTFGDPASREQSRGRAISTVPISLELPAAALTGGAGVSVTSARDRRGPSTSPPPSPPASLPPLASERGGSGWQLSTKSSERSWKDSWNKGSWKGSWKGGTGEQPSLQPPASVRDRAALPPATLPPLAGTRGGSKWQLTDKGGRMSRMSSGSFRRGRGGPVVQSLAWPVARCCDGGWRLRVAWAYNGALLGGGLVWLVIMLRAIDIEHGGKVSFVVVARTPDPSPHPRDCSTASGIDNVDLRGFWRTFMLGVIQAYFLQDVVKILLISFISPAFWSGLLKPGTRRADGLRMCLRGVFNVIIAVV